MEFALELVNAKPRFGVSSEPDYGLFDLQLRTPASEERDLVEHLLRESAFDDGKAWPSGSSVTGDAIGRG